MTAQETCETVTRLIVGQPQDDVQEFLEFCRIPHRTTNISGVAQVVTRDFMPNRVNLTVSWDAIAETLIVTGVSWG